ncbi:MAG: DnaA regulatory inactivator Hda [Piscirickettsiaceae bacterium CG_4_9_14_3_um_filter_43_564]|nr:DnaA regulatory inactivator Hda [Thiomicrospira sp.]OIP93633.1 MAG: DnaA regulatory inactivator Hda [Thiomicrospira sp. CG2_30_44_34]PIQ02861.1 MAG: DnaA regulatory inactivator Hda [Piscirickettsiaceae bacterium CG18_big_fil_WC_8_21_14_2_50_44_103]PIU39138.1 MAG: DnaA regulatory inactivator Hda [Piscirickettsiaceae bacterium CG07_land_8_20_14_0_80_44_28]PIW58623.1 MAG: DnaA regulatory inactivator Hda [Piscirickettsiaceae bacterium CG12_big_fil_rev_8_21_14_0_65_44_934]PIW76869.1 MAG: DnaA re
MFVQLPLKIGLRQEVCFDTYIAEEESVAFKLSQFQKSLADQYSDESFYLFGEAGTGKTHLLQAACRFVTERNRASVYLPLADASLPLIADVLNGLEQTPLVCLDDVDAVLGDRDWEGALTNLIMRAKVLGHQVVMSGRDEITSWSIASSEWLQALMSIMPIALKPLTRKQDIVMALQRHALKLGFELPIEVGNYLVKQFSNDLQELLSVLKLLEQASFVEKRRMTLPFVKHILSIT